jgi:hypothetical protein
LREDAGEWYGKFHTTLLYPLRAPPTITSEHFGAHEPFFGEEGKSLALPGIETEIVQSTAK